MDKCTCGQKYGGGDHSDWCDALLKPGIVVKEIEFPIIKGPLAPFTDSVGGKWLLGIEAVYHAHLTDGPRMTEVLTSQRQHDHALGLRIRLKEIEGSSPRLRIAYVMVSSSVDQNGNVHQYYKLCEQSRKLMEENRNNLDEMYGEWL